jgi:hypothetical protein
MAPETLCSQCHTLPFPTLFFGPLVDRNKELPFRPLHKVLSETACRFCLFVQKLLYAHFGAKYLGMFLRNGHYADVVFYPAPIDVSYQALYGPSNEEMALCVEIGFRVPDHLLGRQPSLLRVDRRRDDNFNRDWVMPAMFALRSGGQKLPQQLPVRFVDHVTIDWNLLKSWDSGCLGHRHPMFLGAVLPTDTHRANLRVIDVEKACIVLCPCSAPYIALSYQWGMDQKLKLRKENIHLLETEGYLDIPEGQPAQTIQDALFTVKALGYRYAWVDALCIVQNDTENITQNVNLMDQIYAGAHLTIVAAAGQNAYHGLPGVSAQSPRSECQLSVNIANLDIVSKLEGPHGAINFSRWNTRGWTYQERLLSNRVLTFTDSQVFFHCTQGCGFEEQYHYPPVNNATYTFPDPLAQFDFQTRNLWEIYAIAVEEYSKRSITDPLDKLRAFTGILNFLRRPLRGAFFCGLPANLFDVALLWKQLGPSTRSEGSFPSWSWIGWDGPVMYELVDSMNNMCECIVSQADITLMHNEFRLCSKVDNKSALRTHNPESSEWERVFDEDELSIHYKTTDPSLLQYLYPRPLATVNAAHLKSLSDCENIDTILRISADVATFHLTEVHSHWSDIRGNSKASCKHGIHELCYLAILDDENQMAGTIIVDGRLLPHLINKRHSFLALSRSTLYRIDEDPSWDSATNTFRHWSEQPPGVCQIRSNQAEEHKGQARNFFSTAVEDSDAEPNNSFFDKRYFSADVWWPSINVLLISEKQDGIFERLGVGKIHVDAFELIGEKKKILLG